MNLLKVIDLANADKYVQNKVFKTKIYKGYIIVKRKVNYYLIKYECDFRGIHYGYFIIFQNLDTIKEDIDYTNKLYNYIDTIDEFANDECYNALRKYILKKKVQEILKAP